MRGARGAHYASARWAGKLLLETMERKQTNLCVAADVPTCAGVLALADAVGARCAVATQAELRLTCVRALSLHQGRTFAA